MPREIFYVPRNGGLRPFSKRDLKTIECFIVWEDMIICGRWSQITYMYERYCEYCSEDNLDRRERKDILAAGRCKHGFIERWTSITLKITTPEEMRAGLMDELGLEIYQEFLRARSPVTFRMLRKIEQEFGVYLEHKPTGNLAAPEQINVISMEDDESRISTLIADNRFFSEEELLEKVQQALANDTS